MKKNYFYALFSALMLFVAMPVGAQNFAITDLYGEWKFTADIEFSADATQAQKDQLSGDCAVVISKDESFIAKIVGFAGSQVQQNINDIGQKEGQDMVKITNPNTPQLWNGLYLANANGDNPYGVFDSAAGEWTVKSYGPVYYNVDAVNGLITIPDFTVVSISDYQAVKATVIAKYTNVKMTLTKAEVIEVNDISGDYDFKAGSGQYDTMEGSVIPAEFAVNFAKKSDDNRTYDATIAIEGYKEVVLPATFDGASVKLAYDNTYLDEEKGIRFAPMYGTETKGVIEFKATSNVGSFTLYDGFSFASDAMGEVDGKETLVVNKDYHQWYVAGTLKVPAETPDFSWAGVFDVKVGNAKQDIILADNGASGVEWPAEFQMEIQYWEAIDAYYVTKLFGFDLYNLNGGGFPLVVSADGKSASITLNGGNYGVALLKSNGDGTYLALTNTNSVNNVPVNMTLDEDGTITIEDCFVQNYDFATSSFTAPVVCYQNMTATVHVEGEPEAPAFDWAGTYTLNAGKVDAYDGGTYPSAFEATVVYNEAADMYLVTSFMGNDIASLNYGGLQLKVAEDGKNATINNGYLYAVEPGVKYLKLYDMNASANPVALTLNEDGTVTMANFVIVAAPYGSDEGKQTVAYYQNVTLAKKVETATLAAPVMRSPDTNKEITNVYGITLQFEEAVAVDANFDGEILVKKDGEKVDYAYECKVAGWDPTMVNFALADGVNAPGTYTFEVPAGLITSADGSKSYEGGVFTFTIVVPAPSCYISPDGNLELNAIDKITIEFQNVASVDVNEDAKVILTHGVDENEGIVAMTTNKDGMPCIEITFDEVFEDVGEYQLVIPAGFFTMHGLNGSTVTLEEETVITYSVVEPAEVTPLEIVSVEPAVGEVDQIDKIVVTFNQDIQLAYDNDWQVISKEIYLTDADGNRIKLTENYNGSLGWNQLEYACGTEYAENGWELIIEPITAAGTYTLDVSQIVVNYGKDENWNFKALNGYCEGTYSWTVSGTNASIEGVEAETENAEIYDLTGRRVEKVTNAGIYIINGKKVLVK